MSAGHMVEAVDLHLKIASHVAEIRITQEISMAKQKRTNPVVLKPGMTIGANAAEMDDEFLLQCFVHYPPVELCINMASRGMVIDGRTGSGKTAILKFIHSKSEHSVEIDPSEMAMSYVSNSDALNFLHAIGADLDLLFQALWKHVLCIEFIRLKFSVTNETNSRSVFERLRSRFSKDARKTRAIRYLKD
jgi:Cdc6-like AAA superfamily ATPase